MMKLLAGIEEVSDHCEKESNNGQLHNNNSHEKQSATELAQEVSKPLVNKVSQRSSLYIAVTLMTHLVVTYIHKSRLSERGRDGGGGERERERRERGGDQM